MNKSFKKINTRTIVIAGILGLLVCSVLGVAAWTAANNPAFASILYPTQSNVQDINWAQVDIVKPPADIDVRAFEPVISNADSSSLGPAPAQDPAPSPTPTLVPTEAPTSIPEVIETPAQLSMEVLSNTPTAEYVPPSPGELPSVATDGNGTRWIDVDLTNQRVYAYEGDTIVNSFLVSTGTWLTPTVTGQYKIYVKYVSNKMSGPGYYLPDVPYIMYFYGSYGLHGTYWHNNFGTPMSHGCVNLRTEDAHWLFDWSSIGTVVNVHY